MNRKQRRAESTRRPGTGAASRGSSQSRRKAAQWFRRGRDLQNAGRQTDAVAAFRNAVSEFPDSAELHGALGGALKSAGEPAAAVSAYRRAIGLDANIAALHNNLGNALLDLGRVDEALLSYRRAIALDPDYADAHGNLGLALRDCGRHDDAVAACRKAVSLAPERADVHANLAAALESAGCLEEAAEVLDRAIEGHPSEPGLRCQRGRLSIKTGDMAAAEAALRSALGVDPRSTAAYFELSELKRFTPDDEDLGAMESLLPSLSQRPQAERIELHFALAKAYEDAGRYDDAFAQLECGNRLQRQRLPFDAKSQKRLFATIKCVFDGDLLARLAGSGDESQLPVFVVGMPRSGTTLVERILGNHPRVHGAGELATLSDLARQASGAGDPIGAVEAMADLGPAECRAMGRDYVEQVQALEPTAERIVDKMPSNFLRIGLIGVILPKARIIHCRRDPADTCLSCYAQLFARGQSFAYDLRDLGRYYTWYRDLMAHWHRILPGRVLDVSYEALVANPQEQVRRLVEHCGLAWDPACLDFHKDRTPVQTASAAQVRRPIYRSSVARWRRYEAQLAPLLELLAETG